MENPRHSSHATPSAAAEHAQPTHSLGQHDADMADSEMHLRQRLLQQVQPSPPQAPGSPHSPGQADPDSDATGPQHHIDPAIAAQYGLTTPTGGADTVVTPDGRRGQKRELSSTKRAAQNRSAQRAFRQRKESYIKDLEEKVRASQAFPALQEEFRTYQLENYHLRGYVLELQNRLIDAVGGYPPPPEGLQLRDPRSGDPLVGGSGAAPPAAQMSPSHHPGHATGQDVDGRERERDRASVGEPEMPGNAVSQLQAAAAQANEYDDAKRAPGASPYRKGGG